MCGIFGSLGISLGDVNIQGVFNTLKNRGPNDQGYSFDEKNGVLLGHTRLSIHDLSPLGHQPMISPTARYEIAFNGEIYNYGSLKEELIRLGYTFRGDSDTEVMLSCFEEYGVVKSLEKFIGMFAFSLHDQQKQRLYLARDRMGEKPLFYHLTERSLAWGSGVSVFRHFKTLKRSISKPSLAKLLRYNYIPSPSSIYNEVFKLPPGSLMVMDLRKGLGAKVIKKYWAVQDHVEKEPLRFDSDQEAIDELERLVENAVSGQMQSDVPLGAFLSGGVDSSLIVAMMQKLGSQKVKTFSMGFEVEKYNEAPFAREVANHLKTDHTEYIVTAQDALDVIPNLGSIYDEPFADSSQLPTYLVSKLARNQVTVALSGDGGDELFYGYGRYDLTEKRFNQFDKWGFSLWGNYLAKIPLQTRNLISNALSGKVTSRQLKSVAELMKYQEKNEFYHSCVSVNLDSENIVLGATLENSKNPLFDLFKEGGAENYSYIDMLTYLPDDILTKVDRAAMGVSLETRVPLLDHKIVEFALRLPMTYKSREGQGKWILRELLYRQVPRELIERPKKGFAVPLGSWLREDLRPWAEDLLSEKTLIDEGLLSRKLIRSMWNQHLIGADLSPQLWPILMLNQWIRNHK